MNEARRVTTKLRAAIERYVGVPSALQFTVVLVNFGTEVQPARLVLAERGGSGSSSKPDLQLASSILR